MNKKQLAKAMKIYDELLLGIAEDHRFLQSIGAEKPGSFPTEIGQKKAKPVREAGEEGGA